jgi:hypothetical protein
LTWGNAISGTTEFSRLSELGMKMKKTYSKPALVKEQKLTTITAAPVASGKAPPP